MVKRYLARCASSAASAKEAATSACDAPTGRRYTYAARYPPKPEAAPRKVARIRPPSTLGTKRTAAINEVAKLLESDPNVASFQGFYNELLARERLDTTCLGNEIALPHARTEHVKKIVIAVGRSAGGVHFEGVSPRIGARTPPGACDIRGPIPTM